MIEIFNISIHHEYEEGKCTQTYLHPISSLDRLMFNNRLRFKQSMGELTAYCEDDRLVLSEHDYLCFWLRYKNTDLVQYSDFEADIVFNAPQFQWKEQAPEVRENSYLLQREELSDETKQLFQLEKVTSLSQTIGLVAIATQLLQEKQTFEIQFKTKRTFWEYRIRSTYKAEEWEFALEDKEEEWEFKSTRESGELRFTSKTELPYYKLANERLVLKWKPLNDPYNYQVYRKVLPFPSYQYQETIDQKTISPVYITI